MSNLLFLFLFFVSILLPSASSISSQGVQEYIPYTYIPPSHVQGPGLKINKSKDKPQLTTGPPRGTDRTGCMLLVPVL